MSIAVDPFNTDAELIVDSDAVLAFSLSALKLLQSVVWWNSKIIQSNGSVDHRQLSLCGSSKIGRRHSFALAYLPELLSVPIPKALYRHSIV
jgi:hypothetical protein